ncbi:hypothetical protein Tco_1539530 [Tanacetum coccineum]
MQTQESKVDLGKALDAGLVVMESSETESGKQDTSNRSGNDADVDDADIKPVYEKSQWLSPMLDSALDNKTTEFSNQFLESENICLKKTVAQFQKDFSKLEAHCIALELKCQNQSSNENADLKAHIQEKVFAIAALKNDLRKLKGNTVDTKFAKPSVLGKPVLQPFKNQSVARQPTAFKSKGPKISKPMFASQVDVKKDLPKPVTQHYLPKGRESTFAKPDHVIASSESRNSPKNMPRFSFNDMVHNHYLEEAKKKTQEKDRNSKSSTSLKNTTNGSKPKPRNNNQTSKSFSVSKSSCITSNVVPLVDHSRNSSPFLNSKHFVCSTCHKCVLNENHDACITKFLKEVNSRHMFSPNKSSVVYEKTSPRSSLRWKPTGRILNTVGLRWIPTGKLFDSCIEGYHFYSFLLYDEYFNGENQVVSKSFVVTTADASDKCQQQPDSTLSTSTLATTVTTDGNFDL